MVLKESLKPKRKSGDVDENSEAELGAECGSGELAALDDPRKVQKPKKARKAEDDQKPQKTPKAEEVQRVTKKAVERAPEKSKPKAKAKAKVKAKAKARAEKTKKEATPAKNKAKGKATFARRYEPQTKDGSKWWRALRTSFEELVQDEVEKPSSIEERCEPCAFGVL